MIRGISRRFGFVLLFAWAVAAQPVLARPHPQAPAALVAPDRVVPLEAGSNFRDLGGYPAAGGRHVRWGLIYRSGATPLLTEADRTRIAGLHLARMIDLRSDEERQIAPTRIDGVPYTAVGYSMQAMNLSGGTPAIYAAMPRLLAPHLRQVFASLLRHEGPLVFNCSAGQDRTGFTAALILSALGTPWPVIIEDYHLSTRLRRPQFEMPRIDAAKWPGNPIAQMYARGQDDPRALVPKPLMTVEGKPFLDLAFAELRRGWGGTDAYLRKEIGLTPADITRLRALYTR